MKLSETITMPDIADGIFKYIKLNGGLAVMSSLDIDNLDYDYYLSRSGDKRISPAFQKMIDNSMDYKNVLSKMLVSKFNEKWISLYGTLTADYDALKNYDITETGTDGKTETPNITKTGEKKQGTNLKTSGSTDNNVYAFNSDASVPIDAGASNQSVTGSKDDNITQNTETETGSRATSKNHAYEKSGNNTDVQSLIRKELEIKKIRIFDIIEKDVDTLLCCDVY